MKQILIFPYNGNGLEAVDCLGNDFELTGFIDDTPEKLGKNKYGQMIFPRQKLQDSKEAFVLAVPGSPGSFTIRKKIIDELNIVQERFATVIHPRANVSPLAQIGKNVLIMAGVVITSNAIIEDHVCILPNTVIHHDVLIKKYTLIGSNVSVAGGTEIGENCYIGSGSKIINNITIGNKVLIGLGTNVIKSVGDNLRLVGNPARIV
jgi:sugar O-acyltransferase (sialic acid O-acetyltransferase NeuD family)